MASGALEVQLETPVKRGNVQSDRYDEPERKDVDGHGESSTLNESTRLRKLR